MVLVFGQSGQDRTEYLGRERRMHSGLSSYRPECAGNPLSEKRSDARTSSGWSVPGSAWKERGGRNGTGGAVAGRDTGDRLRNIEFGALHG